MVDSSIKMEIDPDNMRILLLNKSPFFRFRKPETFHEKNYFYYEAQRFCYLYQSTILVTTDKLMEMVKKPISYWIDENDHLFYHNSDKKLIGKFITNKTCNKIRFVNVLNFKSRFWCGMP